MVLSCVDDSFYVRVNLSDSDVYRLRSCVGPFDTVHGTAGRCQTNEKMIVSCGFPISEVSVLKGLMWSFPVVMRGAST